MKGGENRSNKRMRWFNLAYWLVVVIMLSLTALTYQPDESIHLFGGGSIESLMTLCPPSFTISISLMILCVLMRYFVFLKAKIRLVLFFVVFVFWFFSGRTIGVYAYGRIQTGWFYIPTNQIELCDEYANCEDALHYETSVNKEALLFVKVKNKKVEHHIYVGTVIMEKVIMALNIVTAK